MFFQAPEKLNTCKKNILNISISVHKVNYHIATKTI